MKTINFKYIALAMCAATTIALASCDDDDDDDADADTSTDTTDESTDALADGSTLVGTTAEDVTLAANCTYYLSGEYIVASPATLNIEEGVTIIAIDDDVTDYILIEQGAKINAVGTATNPIVMTSQNTEAGAWGGIHICGYAHTNTDGGSGLSEIGDATYGGDDDADNSGTLMYVRIEYSGYALDEEHEANGFTFYGVGRGTTVEYCQAYKGSDDGFEFFGGSVNVKHCVSTSCSDDSFDWTEGWDGYAQFLIAYQEDSETLGYDCDCLLECDNNGTSNDAEPVAHPILANLTLVGNNSDDNKRGVRLRAGTQVELRNSIITGKAKAITIATTSTSTSFDEGVSVLEGNFVTTELVNEEDGAYDNEAFIAAGNTVDTDGTYIALSNSYYGTISSSISITSDDFFTATSYAGALSTTDDWTEGWTR